MQNMKRAIMDGTSNGSFFFNVTSPVFHDNTPCTLRLDREEPHPVLDPLSQILGEIRRPVLKTGDSG